RKWIKRGAPAYEVMVRFFAFAKEKPGKKARGILSARGQQQQQPINNNNHGQKEKSRRKAKAQIHLQPQTQEGSAPPKNSVGGGSIAQSGSPDVQAEVIGGMIQWADSRNARRGNPLFVPQACSCCGNED